MADRCFLPPVPALHEAVDLLALAAGGLRDGDPEASAAALRSIDSAAVAAHWAAVGELWPLRHDQTTHVPVVEKQPARVIPVALKRSVARRDGWRCRYCDLRVIAPSTLLAIHEALPDDFPDGHPCWRALRATWDHVEPFWAGGAHNEGNLVVSCGACNNQAKGSCTVQELGLEDPRPHAPVLDGWDGLAGWLGTAVP